MQMSDFAWVFSVIANLVGVLFIVMQVRVSLEKRLSVLETYVKILMRDRGIDIRSTDIDYIRQRKNEKSESSERKI